MACSIDISLPFLYGFRVSVDKKMLSPYNHMQGNGPLEKYCLFVKIFLDSL
jgi:hypothetical protein